MKKVKCTTCKGSFDSDSEGFIGVMGKRKVKFCPTCTSDLCIMFEKIYCTDCEYKLSPDDFEEAKDRLIHGKKELIHASSLGMTEEEVKTYIREENWNKFVEWIGGQTCPVLEDGVLGYFPWDVERFKNLVLKDKPTYWD